jgi:uncharacterized membrane protein YeaQ/YmgE (transglycosylase-associated protein family)
MFETQSIVIILLVGLLAGWLAAKIVQGAGLGIVGDIIVGIIGAFIGRWLLVDMHVLTRLHITLGGGAFVRDLVTATIGAILLLLVIRIVRRI